METQPATSKGALWAGRILTALPALMLLGSGTMKLTHSDKIVSQFAMFGYHASALTVIGLLELACTVLYLIPATAGLGAVLLTGYLGGAVATHARIGDPALIAPLVLGMMVWGGLYFRDSRVQGLLPLRR